VATRARDPISGRIAPIADRGVVGFFQFIEGVAEVAGEPIRFRLNVILDTMPGAS
jgi:hypothetical protein